MGKAKASGKGGGSSSKPDHMTDDEWTLYNNVAELVMNLRGASPLNTVSVTLTRGQASLYLWQHACSSAAKTEEIISCGGIQQAMNGLRICEPHETPSIAGLICTLSGANESAREQLISTKAVYPNPSINLLALLWEFLGCNSPATEVCAVGTLCNLAENLDTRKAVVNEATKDPRSLFKVIWNAPSAQARGQAALALKHCCTPVPDEPRTAADTLTETLVAQGGVQECIAALRNRCNDCTSAKREWAIPVIEHVGSLLRRMLTVERAKKLAVQAGVVDAIAEILSPDTKLPAALSYEATAEMLSVLALITIPVGFSAEELDDLSRASRLNGTSEVIQALANGAGGEAAEDDEEEYPDNVSDAGGKETSAVVPQLSAEERAAKKQQLYSLSKTLEDHVDLVANAGLIRDIVKAMHPPVSDGDAGGKKKKGKKEPPLPPGMAECHQFAAQCVRHLVLFPQHARNVVKAGAIPLLNKLTESKVRETRLHAQGALLSLGGSAGAVDIMKKCDVPQYILFMSSMKMVEEEKKVAVLERKAVADALKEEEAQNRVPQVGSYKSSGVGAA